MKHCNFFMYDFNVICNILYPFCALDCLKKIIPLQVLFYFPTDKICNCFHYCVLLWLRVVVSMLIHAQLWDIIPVRSALDSHLGNLDFNSSYRWNIQIEDCMFFLRVFLWLRIKYHTVGQKSCYSFLQIHLSCITNLPHSIWFYTNWTDDIWK